MINPYHESVKIQARNTVRSLLAARTQPNPRAYVSRMGYNTACTSYTQGIEIARLSGSSINRAEQQKRKDELQNLLEKETQIYEASGWSVDEYLQYKSQIDSLRAHLLAKSRAKNRISTSQNKRSMSIHVLSKRSKGKLRDKCTAFYRSCGKHKTFATLTFISKVEDKAAISILNKFLTELRETFQNVKYIWVAERQKNDNIHFHLIINKFVPVEQFNSIWVLQQFRSGLTWLNYNLSDIEQRHVAGTIGEILNPLDVKKIKSIYGLSFYLTKYITKNNNAEGFQCLAWHCSRSVSRLFTKTIISRSCMSEVSSNKNSRLSLKTGKIIYAQKKIHAFYQLFYIENKIHFLPEMAELEKINSWILEGFPVGEVPKENDYSIIKFYCN